MTRNQHYRHAERLLYCCDTAVYCSDHQIPDLLSALAHAVLASVDLDVELAHALGEQKRPAT